SCSISPKTVGTTCHDTPNLSLSHPHWTSWPPPESFSQKWSTSACVSQFTTKEIASVNLKIGPPFNATNSCPLSSNATVITDPFWSSGGLRRLFGVAGHASDLRVFEDRHVKIHGVFSLMIEPQERADLLHRLPHWCLPCPVLSVSIRRSNGEPSNRQCVAPIMKGANPLPLSSSLG